MMLKFKFEEKMIVSKDKNQGNIFKLLSDALESIGFIDIKPSTDSIEFKSNIKDNKLESFQRRYGKGKIYVRDQADTIEISIQQNLKKSFFNDVWINFALLIFINTAYWYKKHPENLMAFIAIFNLLFIASPFVGYFWGRTLITHKQKELLKLIGNYINNK
jgi:hypothetical protein